MWLVTKSEKMGFFIIGPQCAMRACMEENAQALPRLPLPCVPRTHACAAPACMHAWMDGRPCTYAPLRAHRMRSTGSRMCLEAMSTGCLLKDCTAHTHTAREATQSRSGMDLTCTCRPRMAELERCIHACMQGLRAYVHRCTHAAPRRWCAAPWPLCPPPLAQGGLRCGALPRLALGVKHVHVLERDAERRRALDADEVHLADLHACMHGHRHRRVRLRVHSQAAKRKNKALHTCMMGLHVRPHSL